MIAEVEREQKAGGPFHWYKCCYANWFCGHRDYSKCILHFSFSIFRVHEYFIFIRFLSFCQLMRLKMFSIISAAFAEWYVIRMCCISNCVEEGWLAHSKRTMSHWNTASNRICRGLFAIHTTNKVNKAPPPTPMTTNSPFSALPLCFLLSFTFSKDNPPGIPCSSGVRRVPTGECEKQ